MGTSTNCVPNFLLVKVCHQARYKEIAQKFKQGANLSVRAGAIAPGSQLTAPDKHKN
jgi:hypothetical protein